MKSLALIDQALAAAKEAAHSCRNETARVHFEYAMALLRESWIAESGQNALPAETVVENVRKGLKLIALLTLKNPTKPLDLSE